MQTEAAEPHPARIAMPVALAGMAALAEAMGIGRFAFTPILPMMLRDTGLSLTNGAWLASANYLGYLAGALSAIWIATSPRTMIRAGLVLTGALTLAMGLTRSLPVWIALRGLGGVASAWVLIYTSAWALPRLTRWGLSRWSGLLFSGVGFGIAATGLFCALLVEGGFSSRAAWALFGGLALLLSLCVWNVLGTDREEPAAAPPEAAAEGAAERRQWTLPKARLVACYGVFGFGYIIPATFLPVIARQAIHHAHITGLFWPIFGLAAAVSTLLAATTLRKLDDRSLLALSYALQAVGSGAIALSPTIPGIALGTLLIGGTFMVITMAGMREAGRIAGAAAGGFMGAMTAAFAVGQIVGPVYASYLARSMGSFSGALLTAAALMGVSAAVLLPRAAAES